MASKWDYEELAFQEIDLSGLKTEGKAKTFKYANEDKKSGYAITIFKGKKDPKKYYVKVEFARKISEETPQEDPEEIQGDVPF